MKKVYSILTVNKKTGGTIMSPFLFEQDEVLSRCKRLRIISKTKKCKFIPILDDLDYKGKEERIWNPEVRELPTDALLNLIFKIQRKGLKRNV